MGPANKNDIYTKRPGVGYYGRIYSAKISADAAHEYYDTESTTDSIHPKWISVNATALINGTGR